MKTDVRLGLACRNIASALAAALPIGMLVR